MEVTAISVLTPNSELVGSDKVSNSQGKSIEQMFATQLSELNSTLNTSSNLVEKLAVGEEVSSHEIIIAMSEAKLSLQLAVEVRDKLLSAYQEIMKMPL